MGSRASPEAKAKPQKEGENYNDYNEYGEEYSKKIRTQNPSDTYH